MYHSSLLGKPLKILFNDRRTSLEYDKYGRLVSTVDGDMKIETTLNAFDLVTKQFVKQFNPSTGSYDLLQSIYIDHDEHSREVSRKIVVAKTGQSFFIQSSYDIESKLVKRVTTVNSDKSLTESLSYDKKRRLLIYSGRNHTTDDLLPQNENGHKFESQIFSYDELDNITAVVTTFPNNGGSDTATFLYDTVNRQQLKQVTHSLVTGPNAYPSVVKFMYDADGNIVAINDSRMSYTVSGRMSSKNDTLYSYDPFDRLVKTDQTVRYYSGCETIQEVDGSNVTDFIRHGDIPVAEIKNGIRKVYGTDQKHSVVTVTDDTSTTRTTYAPFGTAGDNGVRIGYNGELKDTQDCGVYHLGNGARCYFPAISRFLASDTYSPFLGGGLNPYAYCSCDPFNAFDPSGHMSFWSILSIIVGSIASIAAIVAAPFTGGSTLAIAVGIIGGFIGLLSTGLQLGADIAADNGDTSLAEGLGIAATVLGVLGAVVSLGSAGAEIANVMRVRSVFRAARFVPGRSGFVRVGFKVRFKFTKVGRTARTSSSSRPIGL